MKLLLSLATLATILPSAARAANCDSVSTGYLDLFGSDKTEAEHCQSVYARQGLLTPYRCSKSTGKACCDSTEDNLDHIVMGSCTRAGNPLVCIATSSLDPGERISDETPGEVCRRSFSQAIPYECSGGLGYACCVDGLDDLIEPENGDLGTCQRMAGGTEPEPVVSGVESAPEAVVVDSAAVSSPKGLAAIAVAASLVASGLMV